MPALEIREMKKAFGGNQVLKGVSLTVEEGEVVAILGPSGSGKSTLLRCATFLETMDHGEILYFGKTALKKEYGLKVNKENEQDFRHDFGLVFQNFNLFPHWTVMRNLMDSPVKVQKRNEQEVREHCKDLLRSMGLLDKANSYPSELSGGQQQRVAIARALARNPKMLYFDEPTSALDPELTGEILQIIRSLADDNMTMVIVTHEMDFAAEVADRALFVDNGVVIEEGDAKELILRPTEERTKRFLQKLQGKNRP
ncbi:amino acid ABC transporter ATP-binding protein [Actinotignum urinale]|uniref:Amino acid ABC transporter ATP-binding protein n=1 Tax=Actinotignum urinale TaxID=190146 RepID=A0AAW9HMI1_9ACTO|nr:amino acid ABC transporter ATP-binding protein [Actinotignum urinale]MDY5128531.1 amino acid ABC transporter ATP-binding protein [Actinotignum urinale]MDY5132634.1 amino acid ABC transporter ATP-binding protein [Actinotignum urinale]MDY5151275.1 amino acid ABC transporter ATP-binding protein [Actinotignum urinale]MDY5155105.1 amino acid ABC transporter ATP-binding protein [Actinotignum urinale]MDY5160620.1 amino acid ABC transporter ATP-binding protein [Actinotignum urinale]